MKNKHNINLQKYGLSGFEIHAHTTRYSTCSHMEPEEYIDAARKKGLSGICVTEHNTFWEEKEFKKLCQYGNDLVIINGIEQRCWDGDVLQGDFLVYGCKFHLDRPTVHQLIDIVHKSGGIVIAAHPFRQDLGVSEELVHHLDLDALEVYSCNQEPWQTELAISTAEKMDIPVIAGSDAHIPEFVGYSATEFTVPVGNEQDFLNAIRNRHFIVRAREK